MPIDIVFITLYFCVIFIFFYEMHENVSLIKEIVELRKKNEEMSFRLDFYRNIKFYVIDKVDRIGGDYNAK